MYIYGSQSTPLVKYGLILVYLLQQAIMIAIFLADPGVAAKQRIEFEKPLTEIQAKYPVLTQKILLPAVRHD